MTEAKIDLAAHEAAIAIYMSRRMPQLCSSDVTFIYGRRLGHMKAEIYKTGRGFYDFREIDPCHPEGIISWQQQTWQKNLLPLEAFHLLMAYEASIHAYQENGTNRAFFSGDKPHFVKALLALGILDRRDGDTEEQLAARALEKIAVPADIETLVNQRRAAQPHAPDKKSLAERLKRSGLFVVGANGAR